MTDREMLELAAKAAGISGTWSKGYQPHGDTEVDGIETGCQFLWNSLVSDGDAFRLLCKKSMRIVERHGGAYRAVQFTIDDVEGDEAEHEIEWPHTPTATRYAITSAAAEIGKAMQETTS